MKYYYLLTNITRQISNIHVLHNGILIGIKYHNIFASGPSHRPCGLLPVQKITILVSGLVTPGNWFPKS